MLKFLLVLLTTCISLICQAVNVEKLGDEKYYVIRNALMAGYNIKSLNETDWVKIYNNSLDKQEDVCNFRRDPLEDELNK